MGLCARILCASGRLFRPKTSLPNLCYNENMAVKMEEYHIIETGSGPRIGGSRAYEYDVLDAMNDGYNLLEICGTYNLLPDQVQISFDYIEEHHDRLQVELAEIIRRTEEGQRETAALMKKIEEERRSKPLSPKWKAFYEFRDRKLREIEARSQQNGHRSE